MTGIKGWTLDSREGMVTLQVGEVILGFTWIDVLELATSMIASAGYAAADVGADPAIVQARLTEAAEATQRKFGDPA